MAKKRIKGLTRYERALLKIRIFYSGFGIEADTAQFFRALNRGDRRGKAAQINQIIKKWEKIKGELRRL